MITSADFRAAVQTHIEHPGESRVPGRGEVLLLGATRNGTWARMRISRRYQWIAPTLVRAFVSEKAIERMAIVVAGDAAREFRVGFAERDRDADRSEMSDRRLAKLVAAAREQWAHTRRRLWRLWGRPWPAAVLPLLLLFQVGPFVIWDARHGLFASPVSDAYYALIVVTAAVFWLQVRFRNALTLFLAGVQLVRTAVLFAPLIQSRGFAVEAVWLGLYLSEPAVILVFLWLLYADRAAARIDSER